MPEIKIHYYQRAILKKLTLSPSLHFNQLIIPGLESEHMNYHLKKLLKYGLVNKNVTDYALTDKGKDYSNSLDDNIETVEKQPKTSIIIYGVRQNPKTGDIEHLLNRRLRQPYWGKVGRITGKVKFGETLQAAAARELYEETGLTAKHLVLDSVYHKMRHRGNGEYVQDVLFYIFFVTDFSGKLIEKSEFQENFWISNNEYLRRKDLDVYDDFELDDRDQAHKYLEFKESDQLALGY